MSKFGRRLWVIGESGEPLEATGYPCLPNNPDIWHFPDLQYYTGCVYDSRHAALNRQVMRPGNWANDYWKSGFLIGVGTAMLVGTIVYIVIHLVIS